MLSQADCFRLPLPANSVHCVVTSPPYWGLRKYAGEQGPEPLGLEPTVERHIERTVQWAREVRRVLRNDGVFWLNYGDCYGGGTQTGRNDNGRPDKARGWAEYDIPRQRIVKISVAGNLMLMPHRIALALQADGWIVRQDLVWSKPNPMPESVAGWRWQDGALRRGSWRHTRSHEYVFMLTKQMQYWSDQETVREPSTLQGGSAVDFARATKEAEVPGQAYLQHRIQREGTRDNGSRNPRSVLHISTAPYRGAHYATFPPALIAPLILATCPRWCCPVCGQGWAPVVEQTYHNDITADGRPSPGNNVRGGEEIGAKTFASGECTRLVSNTLGYRPTCDHPHTQAEAVPGIVLDPFVGSGTTVMVARQLLRRGIGFDISRPYLAEQAAGRLGQASETQLRDLPLFD